VRNMAAEFFLRASFHIRKVLLHAVDLRHGTDGFTSPPNEVISFLKACMSLTELFRVIRQKELQDSKETCNALDVLRHPLLQFVDIS
jgi:hypothetical protein